MTPDQIVNAMSKKNLLLQEKEVEYLDLSEKRAQLERQYNIAVATKTTELEIQDKKMAIINKLVKGDPAIAKLKYELDVTKGVLRACSQSIKDIGKAIDSYRSMLSYAKRHIPEIT